MTTKRPALTATFAVLGAACGAPRPPEARVVDVREMPSSSSVDREPVTLREDDRFPGGRGVTLVQDDLADALAFVEVRAPYETRLAAVRARLGVDGEEIRTGVAFRAVGPKNVTGPFGCFELAVERKVGYATIVPIDRRLCGLPYRDDASRPYTGPGPRATVTRLQRIADEMKSLPPGDTEGMARARLGPPDDEAKLAWFGIGGRDDDAPISCHWLTVDAQRAARVERRPLEACGIAWPPPKRAFMRDEGLASPAVSIVEDDCAASCSMADVCIARRTIEKETTLTVRGDDLFAFRLDGRPARISLSTSCMPIPASCQPAPSLMCVQTHGSSWTPRPGGPPPPRPLASPCATTDEDVTSSSWRRTSTGRFALACNTRKKA